MGLGGKLDIYTPEPRQHISSMSATRCPEVVRAIAVLASWRVLAITNHLTRGVQDVMGVSTAVQCILVDLYVVTVE